MPTLNSQYLQNWTGDAKPIKIGEGEQAQNVTPFTAFQDALQGAELAFTQKVTQDNSETLRVGTLISNQGLQQLDPGTALLADVVAEINKINTVLSGLAQVGKNNNSDTFST